MTEFEEIYRTYFPSVLRFVRSLGSDESTAEEIAQETFFRAMTHLDRFDGRCRLFTWLCQIARNTYLSHTAKQSRRAPPAGPLPYQAAPGPEQALIDQETARLACHLLHQLREPYQEVFSLRVFGELSFSRIGSLFGRTDSWARVIFYRAKQELRRALDNEDAL